MKLMTKEIEKKIPPLYAQENVKAGDKMIYAKFFHPMSNWTWYAAEYDPKERLFWGYVEGHFPEWGYFSLDELESVKGPFGLGIERDMYFRPQKFKELKLNEIRESVNKIKKSIEKYGIKILLEVIGDEDHMDISPNAPFKVFIKNRDNNEIEAEYYREDNYSAYELKDLIETALNLQKWFVTIEELGKEIYRSDIYKSDAVSKYAGKHFGSNSPMFAMQESGTVYLDKDQDDVLQALVLKNKHLSKDKIFNIARKDEMFNNVSDDDLTLSIDHALIMSKYFI